MTLANLLTSAQIVLTGLFIYRVQRFLRTHRTWELSSAFLILTVLIGAALKSEYNTSVHKWLPLVLTLFASLIALEPELVDLKNKLTQRINPNSLNQKRTALREIALAANALAATKTGALIAFERNDSLLKFGATGIEINADIKKELLTTLFTKDTPTHDGGVLIRQGRATHCGAVFPLSERKQIENGLGTRHRAAIGLTEKTDAVCLVVSEEEGTISLAKGGELIYSVPPRQLEKKIQHLLTTAGRPQYYPLHYLKRFSPKLVQNNFIQFSKSPSQKIYELIVVVFWFFTFLFFSSHKTFYPANANEAFLIFLNTPWQYIPSILFGVNSIMLLLSRTLTINGVVSEVKKENRLFFLPLFQRKFSRDDLKAVILKREHSECNIWLLAFLNKKRKAILIDRSTSVKALADSAKKIRDILRIELVT